VALAGWNRVAGQLGEGALSLRYSLYAGFFASALVLAADPARNLGNGLCGRALGFFARYAYGMYVFQNLLLPFLQQALPPEELAARTGSVLLGRLAFIAAGATVTLVVAGASYHCYEVHFLRLKNLFPSGERRQKQGE
jgi:peptidoglycan/LPS O-acetylase OafA/YrhL